jgi:hypothetical protein
MKSTHARLNRAIARSSRPRGSMRATVRAKRYKIFRLIHGVVHHELYHAGQIAILKKG